ncbi:ATP-binding protein [Amycolatopsis sp. NPDC049868]|uniref:ATP-binding protein n=1 Tax=Amycolatopsis sp. NPDC049868 TaxID=3363934 RepID=UPI0037B44F58
MLAAATRSPRKPPTQPSSRPPTRASCPSCCSSSAKTARSAARPAWSSKPDSRAPNASRKDFDFAANPNVSPALVHTLGKGAWIRAGQSICLIGDSGTGKSHLLIGLGTAAAEAGFKVRYVTAAALVNELVEAADDKHLSKTIARYGRVDLLCLDELGYLELDWRGAELLFQVFIEREERSSIAIASNSAFSEWARTFTDPRLCAAIVDRLTFDASIIETGTESFRLRTTKRRRTNRAS